MGNLDAAGDEALPDAAGLIDDLVESIGDDANVLYMSASAAERAQATTTEKPKR